MITRRTLVATALAAVAVPRAEARSTDPIDRLVALSVDKDGYPHVYAVAFVGLDGVVKPSDHVAALAIAPDEAATLAEAFRRRDHARFHANGVRVAGRRYVFLGEDDDGAVIRARRDGYGLCVQETPGGLVIAQSAPGMHQSLANVALWRFTRPTVA